MFDVHFWQDYAEDSNQLSSQTPNLVLTLNLAINLEPDSTLFGHIQTITNNNWHGVLQTYQEMPPAFRRNMTFGHSSRLDNTSLLP